MRRHVLATFVVVVTTSSLFVMPAPATAGPPGPADQGGPVAARSLPDSSRRAGSPGAAGIGDPYFPLDGNGGYDVGHYDLSVSVDPSTGAIRGRERFHAWARTSLSSFHLDLDGLAVDRIRVNGKAAAWSRNGQELIVTPARTLRKGKRFEVAIRYHGTPKVTTVPGIPDAQGGGLRSDDGILILGEPHAAATWFAVNDHPTDKATYTISLTVPKGTEAVSVGRLVDRRTTGTSTRWTWRMRQRMASYLAMAAVGQFDLRSYDSTATGRRVRHLDAIDSGLFRGASPRTGARFAHPAAVPSAYQRLTRTIAVPRTGGELTFWVNRTTEPDYDVLLVEAHRPGADDWTTLPDANGHTSTQSATSCDFLLPENPFLAHYLTAGDQGCAPNGTSGEWNAASGGDSDTAEFWRVDLGAYAGQSVEISLTSVTDFGLTFDGVFVDDLTWPGGSTSFEQGLDGWVSSAPPEGSPAAGGWTVIGAEDVSTVGTRARAALQRTPEILTFLSGIFGRYPFDDAGGTVDDVAALNYSLENQTRPTYDVRGFQDTDPTGGDGLIVHEMSHQWVGDSVSVARWSDVWLNEGFATYITWLWDERERAVTPQSAFDFFAEVIPADDPFWQVTIGDPGADHLFDPAVYIRGAMTLQALRSAIGDDDFFTLLRTWVQTRGDGNGSIEQFSALAEQVSGQDLDAFFELWLFTPGKPPTGITGADTRTAAAAHAIVPTTGAPALDRQVKLWSARR